MKQSTILRLLLLAGLTGGATARAQSVPAATGAAATTSPTATAAVMRHGRMMAAKAGQLVPLTKEMTLANGTSVRPDGTLLMPGGQTMPLREGEQVKMNGMVAPGPRPSQRRVTRFNKHVSAGMMKPAR